MRIKAKLKFNLNFKSEKEQQLLIHQHLVEPILKEVKKKYLRKRTRNLPVNNNAIIDADLIVLTQSELVRIIKQFDNTIASEIYSAITHEKHIVDVEL